MERDSGIDFIKGFLMLGIVWGHAITALSADFFHTGIWIHQFFRVYDLPMFMIVSGYFLKTSFNRHAVREIIINKLTTLLIPIVFWNLLRGYFTLKGFYFLWAVLICCYICVIGHVVSKKIHPCAEFAFYLMITVLLHVISIPFNLFYLFPFFCFGYYLKDISFQVSYRRYIVILLLFIVGLCFWTPEYTPWKCGFNAWQQDMGCMLVYIYRFLLAVAGVYVMAGVFNMLHDSFPKKITALILWVGRETLALYILQFFIIETILYKSVRYLPIPDVYSKYGEIVHSLIGYLIAPIVAIVTIWTSLYVIRFFKEQKLTKWVFGIRYK